jgi:hypothetical protein
VQRLSEVALAPRPPEARARLQDAAADAAAWIRTFLDCQAVEAFNFDGGVDPARPW